MANNNIYYLLLGGNQSNTEDLFGKSINLLNEFGSVIRTSKIYSSEPWGFESKNLFLNQAIEYVSDLSPESLLINIHQIESSLGRKRKNTGIYEDRAIDIDILIWNKGKFSSKNLTIPHAELHKRAFALIPLNELCEDYVHPVKGKKISELLFEHNNSQ